jgi:hypothetical protein
VIRVDWGSLGPGRRDGPAPARPSRHCHGGRAVLVVTLLVSTRDDSQNLEVGVDLVETSSLRLEGRLGGLSRAGLGPHGRAGFRIKGGPCVAESIGTLRVVPRREVTPGGGGGGHWRELPVTAWAAWVPDPH